MQLVSLVCGRSAVRRRQARSRCMLNAGMCQSGFLVLRIERIFSIVLAVAMPLARSDRVATGERRIFAAPRRARGVCSARYWTRLGLSQTQIPDGDENRSAIWFLYMHCRRFQRTVDKGTRRQAGGAVCCGAAREAGASAAFD